MICLAAFCYGYTRGLDELRSNYGWGEGFDSGWESGWEDGWKSGYIRGMEHNEQTADEINKMREDDAKWGKGATD